VHGPAPGDHQSQHCTDGGGLHQRAESLIIVPTGALGEPLEDPTCLVPIKGTVSPKLVLEDPLLSDDISPWGLGYQVPCPVRQQGLILLLHSVTPVGVGEHATDRGRDRRQCRRHHDGECQTCNTPYYRILNCLL
jgi:hypothetical protein